MKPKKQYNSKYKKLTFDAEMDLTAMLSFFQNDLKIDILNSTRAELYPKYRSLFDAVARRKHKLSDEAISEFYAKHGFKRDRSTIGAAINMFKSNAKDYPELQNYMYVLYPPSNPNRGKKEVMYVNGQDNLTELQKLVSDIPKDREQELYEMINLRIKSWAWKSKDKITIHDTYQ